MNSIPVEFWKSLSDAEWMQTVRTSSLDQRLCARLWAMQGRIDKPPQKLMVMLNRDDLMLALKKNSPQAKDRQ